MKTIRAIVFALSLFVAVGYAQPKITQVSNAASFSLSPLPNSSIAQGSFFAIFGTGLGPAASACGANLVNCIWKPYPLPTSIQNASVTVNVGGKSVSAYLYFAISTQINAVLPSTTPLGTGTVTVTYNNQASATAPITVVASSFGAFTVNQAGSGPAIITDANFQVNSLTHTAKPGQVMILWGTGLGALPDPSTEATEAPCPNGCNFLTSNPNLVTVWVGTQKASVAYAGRSGYTAEDAVYFTVPTSNVQGCYVQVAVQVNPQGGAQAVSNFTSLAVDPNGATCSDADGINVSDISAALLSKGSANVAAISLLSNFLNINTPLLNLQWDNDTVNANIGGFTTGVLNESQGFTLSPSVNNCTVSAFQGYPPPSDPSLRLETNLDAGSALSAQGGGVTMQVNKNMPPASAPPGTAGIGYGGLVGGSTISQLIQGGGLPPFYLSPTFGLVAGKYTVTAPGGSGKSAVGPFSATINVSSEAASFQWTNQKSVTSSAIDRTQPLTITWSGGDPNGFVDITAIASTAKGSGGPAPAGQTPLPGTLVECLVSAGPGTFTIPSFVLQGLSSTVGSQSLIPVGELLVGPASGAVKVSPTPSGLDAAYIFYHFIQGQNVDWK